MGRDYHSPIQQVELPQTDGFFQHSVLTYHALTDGTLQTLYKGTALARRCGLSTNRVSMFLARNKRDMEGIYQSIWYRQNLRRKYPKVGSYFVTSSVCHEFLRRLAKKKAQ
jgi:hypothetical protein